jgi:2-oxoglutarate ferredoxin oxidoreductase subunit gamma
MRTEEIILSGFGGQGIVAAGKTIAYAGMLDARKVSMFPSYGPEMRGGFANCHVILSDTEIASPLVSKADVVIAMSLPALQRFESWVRPGKTLIVDSHQIKSAAYRSDIEVLEIPASRLALELGSIKFANVILIGAMMAVLKAPSYRSMEAAVKDMLPKGKQELFPLEMQALDMGMNYMKQEI